MVKKHISLFRFDLRINSNLLLPAATVFNKINTKFKKVGMGNNIIGAFKATIK